MDNIIGHTNLIRVLNYLKKKYYNIPKDSNGEYTIGDALKGSLPVFVQVEKSKLVPHIFLTSWLPL